MNEKKYYTEIDYIFYYLANDDLFSKFLFLFLSYTDVPASGMYFLSYEYVKELTQKELGTEGGWALVGTILAGGSAGVANWAVGMPADVLKCKYISQNFMSRTFHVFSSISER